MMLEHNNKKMLNKMYINSKIDFVNHDKVFCENSDNTVSYFELYYDEEMGA